MVLFSVRICKQHNHSNEVCKVRILPGWRQRRCHYSLGVLVVCQKIVRKQYVVCMWEFFNLLFCILVQIFLGFLLWLLYEWFFVPLVLNFFLIFLSTVPCFPLYLTLSLFFASSIDSVSAPVSGWLWRWMFVFERLRYWFMRNFLLCLFLANLFFVLWPSFEVKHDFCWLTAALQGFFDLNVHVLRFPSLNYQVSCLWLCLIMEFLVFYPYVLKKEKFLWHRVV